MPTTNIHPSNREAWLEARTHGVGASESPMILGVSPYGGPHDVWRGKVLGERTEETEAMLMGTLLEPVIAAMIAKRLGVTLVEPGLIVDKEKPWVLGTPDRLVVERDDELLQIKAVGLGNIREWGEPDTDEIPEHVIIQVQKELWLTKRQLGRVAALFAGSELKLYKTVADPELQAMIVESDTRFWHDHVLTKTPPTIDGSERASAWLKKSWPRHENKNTKRATGEIEALALRLKEVKPVFKKAETEKESLENQLKAFMGAAERLEGGFGYLTYRNDRSGKPDWKAIAETIGTRFMDLGGSQQETADIITKHTPVPGPRRFLTHYAKAESDE